MNVKICPAEISGTINAPPSKTLAHRLMIAAALSGNKITVKNVGESKDVLATARCLKSFGADCKIENGDFAVNSFSPVTDRIVTADCGESGSTLRFLLPVAAAFGIKADFTGSERLLSRPADKLIECLNKKGAKISGFSVRGKLNYGASENGEIVDCTPENHLMSGKNGTSVDGEIADCKSRKTEKKNDITATNTANISRWEYVIDASVSSQYVTGLMLALGFTDKPSRITVTGKRVSENYIEVTRGVLKSFGVKTVKQKDGYKIIPKSRKSAKNVSAQYQTEGDFSGAAFMLSLGAVCGEVTVKGLNLKSRQGDKKIVKVLKKMGATVRKADGGVTIKKNKLKAITLDCENIPDLVQVISAVAAFAKGVTVLKNVERLRVKESDRIEAILSMLEKAKVDAVFDGNSIKITGGTPQGFQMDGGNDHRTVMSAAVLGAGATGETLITGAQAVEKSYPAFFEDLIKLGENVNVGV